MRRLRGSSGALVGSSRISGDRALSGRTVRAIVRFWVEISRAQRRGTYPGIPVTGLDLGLGRGRVLTYQMKLPIAIGPPSRAEPTAQDIDADKTGLVARRRRLRETHFARLQDARSFSHTLRYRQQIRCRNARETGVGPCRRGLASPIALPPSFWPFVGPSVQRRRRKNTFSPWRLTWGCNMDLPD